MQQTSADPIPAANKKIKSILISQPKPEGTKSPYFDLAAKYNLTLEFCPFIAIEGIPAKEFRKQKIDIASYSAVIFTSRHAIDHFFRVCEEMKISVSQDTKYFCITEAVALYLQKFILYRKRKVFYGADGRNKSLFDVIKKHKDNETFLYPSSEAFDNEISAWLTTNEYGFAKPVLYKVVNNDLKKTLSKKYDIVCLFSPGGVKSLLANDPAFVHNGTALAAFGLSTLKAAEELGLELEIKAPMPQSPSMVSALEKFILSKKK